MCPRATEYAHNDRTALFSEDSYTIARSLEFAGMTVDNTFLSSSFVVMGRGTPFRFQTSTANAFKEELLRLVEAGYHLANAVQYQWVA